MAAETRTENDSVIELARSTAVQVRTVPGAEHLQDVVLPSGHEHYFIDLEHYQDRPRRKTEQVVLHEADSFAHYVVRHRVQASSTLYADLDRDAITAVLDDSATTGPGWGGHRASLTLRRTKSWIHWTRASGKDMSQGDFAEHIEAGLQEIVDPPAAEMYELAQTFQATVGANFRQVGRLADGRRALHFDEQVDARAGEQGDLEIPKQFHLSLQVYDGAPEYPVVARLRFRVREGKLTLSYHLVRPEDVARMAFDAALDAIEQATEIKAFRGTPPVRP